MPKALCPCALETISGQVVRHGVKGEGRLEWKPQHQGVAQPGYGWVAQDFGFFAIGLLEGRGRLEEPTWIAVRGVGARGMQDNDRL